jgi:catechol 2,3-dioxygenase-like lactoylglutathione lyase family enzyme
LPVATGITTVSLVCIPTIDVDASIEFFVDKLGFEKRTDVPFGDDLMRWVEVYPPEGPTGIALAPPPPGRPVEPRDTGIILQVPDVDTARDELAGRGVDIDPEVTRYGGPVPPMAWFRDPEGNSLLLVEAGE